MAKRQAKDLKKRIQLQNMIIIALAIIIVVMIIVSSTAAWYIRTKSDSADLILSNPVIISITEYEPTLGENGELYNEHTIKQDILENYRSRIYPGDRIKLNLGVQLGLEEEESSSAYVRVKITFKFTNLKTGEVGELSDLATQDLIRYENEPDPASWKLLNFNKFKEPENEEETVEPDYWYVLKEGAGINERARVVTNMEQIEFLNGYIKLDKINITNAQANCMFSIYYAVEAIQVANVDDPIVEEGKGFWWGFAKGDSYDDESTETN